MKSSRFILTGAIAAAFAVCSQADSQAATTVYITGATAYRSSAIIAIEALYGAGKYACVYSSKDGSVTTEQKASSVAFKGLPTALNGLAGVEIKCCWAGSVGGLKIIADPNLSITDQPGAKGWIPDSQIPASGTVGLLDTAIAYETGATAALADAAFSDAFAQTVGVTGLIGNGTGSGATDGNVGVIAFEWVSNNGNANATVINVAAYAVTDTVLNYTASSGSALAVGQVIGGKGIKPFTKITAFTGTPAGGGTITIDTPVVVATTAASTIASATYRLNPVSGLQQLQAKRILQGGAYLSQLTGVAAATDAGNQFVYAFGRNADSGTRVSCLAESGIGALGLPQHLQPVIAGGGAGGTGGLPSRRIASMALWPAESVLGTSFAAGQSGYSGGGDLAAALTAWGSIGAPTTAGGVAPLYQDRVGLNGGWIVGYVSRNDAETACAQTGGANTAHRVTWNGQYDWKQVVGFGLTDIRTFTHDGKPVNNYDDAKVQQGAYSLWEYEHFYRNAAADADATKKGILNLLADSIVAGDPGTNNIPISTMKVSRPNEGGVLTHIVTP